MARCLMLYKYQGFLIKGAAHRNIKFNVTVRCTFNLDVADICYKYYGALHLKFLYESPATNAEDQAFLFFSMP
jgi:hypothetical protein